MEERSDMENMNRMTVEKLIFLLNKIEDKTIDNER